MSNFTQFGIFLSLLDGKTHKASELADKFEISTKTVYRQVEKLCYTGFPITSCTGKNGGISVAGKFKLSTWFFSEQELAYLLSLVKSSKNINPTLCAVVSSKLKQHITNTQFTEAQKQVDKLFVDTLPWFSTTTISSEYSTLFKACINSVKVEFCYKQSLRKVDPYCIVYKESNYYLYGYCNKKNQFRLFKLNRISNIIVTDLKFNKQNINLDQKPWNNSKFKTIDVVLQCNESIIKDISCWAKTETVNTDTYKIKAVNNNGLIHKFMEYGDSIKILEPQIIIKSLQLECSKILKNYT